MIVATLHPLQYSILGLVAIAATTVVLTRDVQRQILVSGFYGILLVILFVVFAAPDVALSMLAVTTVGYPLVVLIAIAKSRDK